MYLGRDTFIGSNRTYLSFCIPLGYVLLSHITGKTQAPITPVHRKVIWFFVFLYAAG